MSTTETIKTIIKAYQFRIDRPEEKKQYEELRERLQALGLECMESWGQGSHYLAQFDTTDGVEIELETKHLFDNQWNTAPLKGSERGLRVFDWAQDYPVKIGKNLKQGHYLEQTDEMREIRRNRVACGYCGKQEPAAKGLVFCDKCLDSAYLERNQLHLLRMQSVEKRADRKPLTEAELAWLLPLYTEAQINGSTERGRARIKADRERLEANHKKAIYAAETEFKGMSWLMDKGISLENVIYYNHTDKFSFGWRKPVDAEVKPILEAALEGFPFNYEVK